MFGKVWELKKMYDKYKSLQKILKNLVIRAKQWDYTNSDGDTEQWAIIIDINGEMKLRDIQINDETLLNPTQKKKLEEMITACFQKAQSKAQEVVAEKTKDELWFDPSNLAWMMWGGGWMPGLS